MTCIRRLMWNTKAVPICRAKNRCARLPGGAIAGLPAYSIGNRTPSVSKALKRVICTAVAIINKGTKERLETTEASRHLTNVSDFSEVYFIYCLITMSIQMGSSLESLQQPAYRFYVFCCSVSIVIDPKQCCLFEFFDTRLWNHVVISIPTEA